MAHQQQCTFEVNKRATAKLAKCLQDIGELDAKVRFDAGNAITIFVEAGKLGDVRQIIERSQYKQNVTKEQGGEGPDELPDYGDTKEPGEGEGDGEEETADARTDADEDSELEPDDVDTDLLRDDDEEDEEEEGSGSE